MSPCPASDEARYLPQRRAAADRRSGRSRRGGGFTVLELVVVIGVIGLLVALVTVVANKAIYNQRVSNTRAIMSNLTLAIDQFATEDPLKNLYNPRESPGPDNWWGDNTDVIGSFGPYPPYPLEFQPLNPQNPGPALPTSGTLPEVVERDPPGPGNRLADRLGRDFFNDETPPAGTVNVGIDTDGDGRADFEDSNNDNRALYAYLRVLMPAALNQVPTSAVKPLSGQSEFIVTTGQTGAAGQQKRVEILGFHDAWGVPLDYLLYVKLEPRFGPRTGRYDHSAAFRIVERVPVLRSRGVSRDEYDQAVNAAGSPPTVVKTDPARSIYSVPFPSPGFYASQADRFAHEGLLPPPVDRPLPGGQGDAIGWARLKAWLDPYDYRPHGEEGSE